MLSKEVKDILEGIHFFLVEGLKSEPLSGKSECLRRGLLLQLEGLRTTYPFLHFSSAQDLNAAIPSGSSSPPSVFSPELQNANSSRMSTSSSSTNYSTTGGSSGTSNGSSTGYSVDGGGSKLSNNTSFTSEKNTENYEDFEDMETCSELTTTTRASRRSSTDFPSRSESFDDRDEDSYSEDVEPVPFRILVGKCDHHGMLFKRSKSLLPGMKNSKSFICVLAGSLLYLYQKESDDKQKKTIDLNGYRVQELPHDETSKFHTRKRDFAFSLSGPGKKLHIFFTPKRIIMERWIKYLTQAISSSETSLNTSSFRKSSLSREEENHFQSISHEEEEDEDFTEENEEFYEELNMEKDFHTTHPSLWKPPITPYQTPSVQSQLDTASEYYSVPEAGEVIEPTKHIYYNQLKKAPPERPPLPHILRESLQQKRPLPEAPSLKSGSYEGHDKCNDDEIYCEIEEEKEENFRNSMSSMLTNESSLSKEIFDTINKRVPTLPDKTFSEQRKNVEASVCGVSEPENYDMPSDSPAVIKSNSFKISAHSLISVPSLPPKGTNALGELDEESEYKVPTSNVCPEGIYDVPRNVPVPVEEFSKESRLSGRYEIKSFVTNAETKEDKVSCQSDCLRIKEESVNESLSIENVGENDEEHDQNAESPKPNSTIVTDDTIKINSTNSVKDMIARLNQTDKSFESSQRQFYNNSFKNSKVNQNNVVKNNLVEKKNKIEVSRSIKSIKSDLESKESNGVDGRGFQEKTDDAVIDPTKESSETTQSSINCINAHLPCERDRSKLKTEQENAVYIAKFAFVSTGEDGLSFNRGDEIVVKEARPEDRLWKGELKGREGFVPREYLRKKN